MIQYLIECMAFQLLFLMLYDLFLKRETFFKWNRLFLLVSFGLTLVLPLIQLELFKSALPLSTIDSVVVFQVVEEVVGLGVSTENNGSDMEFISLGYYLFITGILIASSWFLIKLYRLKLIKSKAHNIQHKGYNEVVLSNSDTAFSFFKDVYIGNQLNPEKRVLILEHELVHVRQWHTIDLLFFELMRVLFWYNPLVYLYQKRISEIHEFLADESTSKEGKKKQYQLLLSEVFNTENISYVNSFYKASLIKKRINMIQKRKSKTVVQLKYLFLIPMVMGMLVYTSSSSLLAQKTQDQKIQKQEDYSTVEDQKMINDLIAEYSVLNIDEIRKEHNKVSLEIKNNKSESALKELYFKESILFKMGMDQMFTARNSKKTVPYPSTSSFINYKHKLELFQFLDYNLKISLNGHPIKIINKTSSNKENIVEVLNTKDLTGKEVLMFNKKMNAVFSGNKKDKFVVLKDGKHIFYIGEKIEPLNSKQLY